MVFILLIVVFFIIVIAVASKSKSKPTKKINSNSNNAQFMKAKILNDSRIFIESFSIACTSTDLVIAKSRMDLFYSLYPTVMEYVKSGVVELGAPIEEILKTMDDNQNNINVSHNKLLMFQEKITPGRSNSLCPYCQFNHNEPLKRQKKCPECQKTNYRYKLDKNRFVLITDSEKAEIDAILFDFNANRMDVKISYEFPS